MPPFSEHGHAYGASVIGGCASVQLGDQYIRYAHSINSGTEVAHNSGSITNHVYNSITCEYLLQDAIVMMLTINWTATARTELQPSIVIPFRPNRDFVVRDEFLTLWSRRSRLGSPIALVGLGGVGYAPI